MVPKTVRITVEPGQPLRFEEGDTAATSSSLEPGPDTIGKTFRAYFTALKHLLLTRYGHAIDAVPNYMKHPCQVTVLRCTDAILVRYDIVEDDEAAKVRVLATGKSIENVAPTFTDSVVHAPPDRTNWSPPSDGPQIVMSMIDATGVPTRDIVNFSPKIAISPKWPDHVPYPLPPRRPAPIAGILNEFDLEMTGVVEDVTLSAPREVRADPTHFTVQSHVALQTGWQAIEIYPILTENHWQPVAASQWAEIDLLFALFRRNSRSQELTGLDGRAERRQQVALLLSEFETLLSGAEEPVHQFLKKNPVLLSPTFDRIWSKVPFGGHVSDFVVRETPSDYVLVEIEAPYRELFRRDGHPRHEFTHAIDQINDWLSYLADHRSEFESNYDMRGISLSPRGLVVIGRSSELTEENRRKIAIMQERQPRLRIMTYDDVIAGARMVFEKILGPLSFVVNGAQIYFHGPRSQ